MKKNIVVFIFLINVFSYSAFAANFYDVAKNAKESFKQEYPEALNAQWQTVKDNYLYSVRFVYNNQSYMAYYDYNGSSIGFARVTTMEKLPVKVKKTLAGKLSDYKILGIQELVITDEHTFYFDTLNEEEKFFIGIDSNGGIKKKKKVDQF